MKKKTETSVKSPILKASAAIISAEDARHKAVPSPKNGAPNLSPLAVQVLSCLPLEPVVAVVPELALDLFGDSREGNNVAVRKAIRELQAARWLVRLRKTADPERERAGSKKGWCLARECFAAAKAACADMEQTDKEKDDVRLL